MKSTLSEADRDLLYSARWAANDAIAKGGQGCPRVVIDRLSDIVDAVTEVLDVDIPSHVDKDRLDTPTASKPTPEDEALNGSKGGTATLGRLFVAIGHNRGTGSESHDGLDEWTTSLAVGQRMKELASLYGLEVMIGIRNSKKGYGDAMREHGDNADKFGADFAIEIHRNAYNGKAKGAEFIVASDAGKSGGRIFAAATDLLYSGITIRGDQGVVDRRAGGNGRGFCRAPKSPAIIVEPCFHDTPEDWGQFRDNVEKEARLYLGAAKGAIMFGPDKIPDLTQAREFLNGIFKEGILGI